MAAVNLRKAAVIGCGFVGSASAFVLMLSGLFTDSASVLREVISNVLLSCKFAVNALVFKAAPD